MFFFVSHLLNKSFNESFIFCAVHNPPTREKCQEQPPEVIKKGVLKNFSKFTGKHLCQSLFFNIQKETLAQVFYREFCEIFKNIFFYKTSRDDCF